MPGYWFLYNMYALDRNESKYSGRDKRIDKTQQIEYDVLAPDTVNEMFDALKLMKQFTAKAYAKINKKNIPDTPAGSAELLKTGESILEKNTIAKLEILAEGFENSNRKVQLIKVPEAYKLFKELISYYGITQLIDFIEHRNIQSWKKLLQSLPGTPSRTAWKNIGGQLMPEASVKTLIRNIRSAKINSWDEVHSFYNKKSSTYTAEKFQHAFASLLEVLKLKPKQFTKKIFFNLLQQAVITKEWIAKGIYDSRAKDYENPYRKMVYETQQEMEKVIGKLSANSFINQQQEETITFHKKVNKIVRLFE